MHYQKSPMKFSLREPRLCADFVRRTGTSEFKVFDAAGTIVAGDAVQFDENGEVVVAATNKAVVGIAVNAATSSTTCTVDLVHPGDEWEADIATGTMADAEIGEEADLSDEDALTLTESNNDFLITGWDRNNTAKCYGIFMKPYSTTIAA